MSTSVARRISGMSAVERARLLAKFNAQIATREASDPTAPYRALFALAEPVRYRHSCDRLSEQFETQRKASLVRAWAALEVAKRTDDEHTAQHWRKHARESLREAKRFGYFQRVQLARETLRLVAARLRGES